MPTVIGLVDPALNAVTISTWTPITKAPAGSDEKKAAFEASLSFQFNTRFSVLDTCRGSTLFGGKAGDDLEAVLLRHADVEEEEVGVLRV